MLVPDMGGDDTIDGGGDDDLLLGGFGADSITGGPGSDIAFGDNGFLEFVPTLVGPGLETLQLAATTDPTLGGPDTIALDGGDDLAFGGTGADVITGGADSDILLGDHGRFDPDLPTSLPVESIFTSDAHGAGDDEIHGNGGDDFIPVSYTHLTLPTNREV